MGKGGNAELWRKVEQANGIAMGSSVHCLSADALTHMFMERLYPFLWNGEIKGMPIATITFASNQGFQITANTDLCRWAFAMGMKYVGGLPVHMAYLDDALPKARYLGTKLGELALIDEKKGRTSPTDEEVWLQYQDKPWKVFDNYLENLTMGTRDSEFSIIKRSLARGTFKNKKALDLMMKANEEFEKHSYHFSLGNYEQALKSLVKSSAFWTHATWKEFLEDSIIKAKLPKAYRPINDEK
jgi:hypothetical protein